MKLRPSISALSQVDDEKAKIEAEAEKLNEMMGEIEDEDEATACSERVQYLCATGPTSAQALADEAEAPLSLRYERLEELDSATAEARARAAASNAPAPSAQRGAVAGSRDAQPPARPRFPPRSRPPLLVSPTNKRCARARSCTGSASRPRCSR